MTHRPTLDAMREATRLTRNGRLHEATALLQQALHQARAAADPPARADASPGEVFDVSFREVETADDPARAPHVAPPAASAASAANAPPAAAPPDSSAARAQSGDFHASDFVQGLIGCLGARPGAGTHRHPTHPAPADLGPGRFIEGEFGNAAGRRSYRLYVPSTEHAAPLPLLVMLHGCHQSPEDFAAGTRMNLQAEASGCLVLYPAQAPQANASGCWNWFKREDQVRGRGEPSILADMTRDVMARHAVDPQRVYAAGLSAGGAMAAVLAVTYPDLFAAVAIHSGLACGAAQDLPSALAAMRGMPNPAVAADAAASSPVPTIVFHGDRDRTVHPRNGAQFSTQFDAGASNAAPDAQATTERGQAAGGHAWTRILRRDASGHVVLEYWQVHGGGHAWFGGSQSGSYTDPRGPDASAQILRFLLSHRR